MYVVCNSQKQHIILVCVLQNILVLLLGLGHESEENEKENIILIPNVKNCKDTLSLHRSMYTACIETPLFRVIKVVCM